MMGTCANLGYFITARAVVKIDMWPTTAVVFSCQYVMAVFQHFTVYIMHYY